MKKLYIGALWTVTRFNNPNLSKQIQVAMPENLLDCRFVDSVLANCLFFLFFFFLCFLSPKRRRKRKKKRKEKKYEEGKTNSLYEINSVGLGQIKTNQKE